jgi:hypothetical protein
MYQIPGGEAEWRAELEERAPCPHSAQALGLFDPRTSFPLLDRVRYLHMHAFSNNACMSLVLHCSPSQWWGWNEQTSTTLWAPTTTRRTPPRCHPTPRQQLLLLLLPRRRRLTLTLTSSSSIRRIRMGAASRKGGLEDEARRSCTSRRRRAPSRLPRAWPATSTRPAPAPRRPPPRSSARPAPAAGSRCLLLPLAPPRSAPSAPGISLILPRDPGCPTARAASPWAGASRRQQHQRRRQQQPPERLLLLSLFSFTSHFFTSSYFIFCSLPVCLVNASTLYLYRYKRLSFFLFLFY